MSEEHWDISEKDAEFFARLMGVSRPSDSRPWHAQFPDVHWLVNQVSNGAPPEPVADSAFPDLDLLETAVNESPPDVPPEMDDLEGVDLGWLVFQDSGDWQEPGQEVGESETGADAEESGGPTTSDADQPGPEGAEPGLSEAPAEGISDDALEAILAKLAGLEEAASEVESAESGNVDVVSPQELPEEEAPEAREEQLAGTDTADTSVSSEGFAEPPVFAQDAVRADELALNEIQSAEEETVLPDEGEEPSRVPELEDLDLGELIGASEVEPLAEEMPPEVGIESETLQTQEGAEQEQPAAGLGLEDESGSESAEKSALVPEEWTDLQLDEEGHPGSEALAAQLGIEGEAGEPDALGETEEVIGTAELSERAAVPWSEDAPEEAGTGGDAFVELAVEQRIRRPGLFQRLALVDTDRRVGIEIGKHQVIYTVVVKRGSRFELEGYGIVPVETAESENEQAEKVGLQKVLEEIFSDRSLRQAHIAVADDEMETLIRRLELPRLSKKEMNEALHWALRKELPFDPDAAQIAHTTLSGQADKNSRKVPVLAVAASIPEVEEAVQRLRLSGVKIGALVAPSWALYRLFTRFGESDPETCQVLVHIGALRSEILFVQNGDLLFQRTITTALDDFVNALTSTLFEEGGKVSLSRREAFALLRQYGIPEMGAKGRTDTGLRLTEVAVSVRPVVEKLTNEVERSLDYFKQKFKTQQFGRLWLSGIGATVLNLGGVLENGARVPTEVFRPSPEWPSFHVGNGLPAEILEKHGPALVIPLGLATEKNEPLNLLPSRYRQSSLVRLAQRGIAYSTLLGLIGGGMVSANLAYRTQVARSDIVLLEQQHLRLVKQQAELRRLTNERNDLSRQLAEYLHVLPGRESVSIYLKALSRLTPPSIALTSVELVPPEETAKNPNVGATEGSPTAILRIQGIVFPDPPREGAHLAQFLLGLKQSGLFRSVRLESSRKSDLPRVGIEFLAVGELL